mmetsp:Transcript_81965/g.244456  ORF Transcript_81965/g.244456 Transcript_81965/m.244456 type:complete len:204 (-) Transcript_81965:1633-2244(-)
MQVPHEQAAPRGQQGSDEARKFHHALARKVRRRAPRQVRLKPGGLHGGGQLPGVQCAVPLPVHGPEELREPPDLPERDLRGHVQEHGLLQGVDAVEVQEAVQLLRREAPGFGAAALVAQPGVREDLGHGRPSLVVGREHQPQQVPRLLPAAEVLEGRALLHAASVCLHLLGLGTLRGREWVGVDLKTSVWPAEGGRLLAEQPK